MAPVAIGMVMALGALLMAAMLEKISFGALIAPSPMILVFVGSLGATFIAYKTKEWKKIPKVLGVAFKGKVPDPDELVTSFAHFADIARKEGMLALEGEIGRIEDPFLKTGLQLVIDGVDGEQVREVLEIEIDALTERHHSMSQFFLTMGGFAPTFGLMGTIVGLIGVLRELSDPTKLGKGMALGLLGTLWGVVAANLLFQPLGTKLNRLHEQEVAVRRLAVEGVLGIREGMASRILVERLEARLSPEMRKGHTGRARTSATPKVAA
ncbi:MAG TPA: motility protein A [Acidimicrobiia bacterium]|nr:motility protein A [Acidimicrobiia bacterium]